MCQTDAGGLGFCEKGIIRREWRRPDSRGYCRVQFVSLVSYLLFSPGAIGGSTEYRCDVALENLKTKS